MGKCARLRFKRCVYNTEDRSDNKPQWREAYKLFIIERLTILFIIEQGVKNIRHVAKR